MRMRHQQQWASGMGWAWGFVLILAGAGGAQTPGLDWLTDSSDAQRSAWIRSDQKISVEGLKRTAGTGDHFQFLWKMKVENGPRQMNSLMAPATLDRLIGYRGFRMLGFFGGSEGKIFTIDTDLGRMEWEKRLTSAVPAGRGTLPCPGGMTTGIVRPMLPRIPPVPNYGGRGRRTPALSAVGIPGAGAVTLANVRPTPPAPPPSTQPATPPRPNPANPSGGQLGAGPFLIHALSGDGKFHSLHLSNGADYEPPVPFVPAGASARGLIVVDQVAYVATAGGCGGATDGIWALDLETKQVRTWSGVAAGSAGPAFDGAGTLYVATGGRGARGGQIVALEPRSLAEKSHYSPGPQVRFSSSPVVFEYQGKTLLAAGSTNGQVHLLDTANLAQPLAVTTAGKGSWAPGALSSWQDQNGVRWILAAVEGALPPGFSGPAMEGAIVAWKVVEKGGVFSLLPGWASRSLAAPLAPTIINGVVFALASGEFRPAQPTMSTANRVARSSKAVLYAIDGQTGEELWNSGTRISSFTSGNAIAGGMSQVYVTAYDGTIYTFGFPMEH
jgi:outer membrane protein assembly factor BamB